MKRYLLVDCNNFFVSCERVFNPTLLNKPVVVLSSNDACVIARSNEAKELGIAMGVPAFKCEKIFKKHGVQVLSSNFSLYGDISARVMSTLAEFASDIEIYSIDEAFIFIAEPIKDKQFNDTYYSEYSRLIVRKVKQRTGIPISIGIGPTKTLAKIATTLAKKNPHLKGVFDITAYSATQLDTILDAFDVKDIWGIGYRYANKLHDQKIHTAKDFKYADDSWIRKNLTIVGYRTLLEIRGISCLSITQVPQPKQALCVSRAFGRDVTSIIECKEALAAYITIAAAKMRAQKTMALRITVFIISNKHREADYYYNSREKRLSSGTAYTPDLIKAGNECLESIYKSGYQYKKVGVLLSELVPADFQQLSTYAHADNTQTKILVMQTLDKINKKFGKNKLFFAASGIVKPWQNKQLKKSPNYTTNWHELLTIDLK